MTLDSQDAANDPYWKLRPAPPPSDEDLCHCDPCDVVTVRDELDPNPIYCVACNGQVAPEEIGFDEHFADELARWLSVHQALFTLWLDSGEYEDWAAEKLGDPASSVNVTGLDLVTHLNTRIRTYYWWFKDADPDTLLASCPKCREPLSLYEDRSFQKCDRCSILI